MTLRYCLLSPALGLAAVLVAAAPASAETSLADAYRTIAGKEMVDLTIHFRGPKPSPSGEAKGR